MNRQLNTMSAHHSNSASRAWVDTRTETSQPRNQPRAATIRWATKSLQTSHGKAVAVRLDEQGLSIGLRVSDRESLVWRHAAQVMSESQADRWASEGFAR